MLTEHTDDRPKRIRALRLGLAVALAVAAIGYYVFVRVSMGPDWGVFREKVDPRLHGLIRSRMNELRDDHPDSDIVDQMQEIEKRWGDDKKFRVRLQLIGLSALPYIEEMTRSRREQRRLRAYGMLHYVSPTGTPEYEPTTDREKRFRLWKRFVCPIWERALKDRAAGIRLMALRHWSQDYYGRAGIPLLQRLLRDPDRSVRVKAARKLIWLYRRPDLVPERLQSATKSDPTY